MNHCTKCQVGQGRDCPCRESLSRPNAAGMLVLLCASAWAVLAAVLALLYVAGKGLA